jgi:16S rRNA (adenine1518-N6/adenine1519-N6)-dimethyltransferase
VSDDAERRPIPDGLPPLREVIRELGLSAKKSLGQNFILDLNLTRRIARTAAPLGGKIIIEVGPGPGGLTRALLMEGAGHVIAIERDERCRPALESIAEHYQGRLTLHFGDALDADWRSLLAGHAAPASIVANLPYNVATRLLVAWLETEPWPPWWRHMVLMFQKEVALRIVAKPSTKPYGRLAVISQWRTVPSLIMSLPREAFTPAPAVDSAIVQFAPRDSPEPVCSVATLGRVTAAAFGQRRKMLRQSLRAVTPHPEELLSALAIASHQRAEQIDVSAFARIARALDQGSSRAS